MLKRHEARSLNVVVIASGGIANLSGSLKTSYRPTGGIMVDIDLLGKRFIYIIGYWTQECRAIGRTEERTRMKCLVTGELTPFVKINGNALGLCAVARSALRYRADTWPLNNTQENKLEVATEEWNLE